MEEAPVVREEKGPVSLLTMQYRPYNLLGPTLIGAIADEIAAARDAGTRAIILRSGLRHFSAGADVAQFSARIEQGGRSQSAIGGVDFLKLLELLPIPIVASVHGVCLGGGFELALACDYIVAASSAKIGSVEAALGLHPLLGGIQRQVQRAGAMRAKEISMLGRRYDPATLERWGLVNLVVADDALEGGDNDDRPGTGARADRRACGDQAPCAHRRQSRGARSRRGDGRDPEADLGLQGPRDRSGLVPRKRSRPRQIHGALT
jgi:enoyl-CoA hydratase/carnithine racemase